MTSTIRAIDMFCGGGGSTSGATLAGVEVVAGFDIWKTATAVYSANYPSVKIYPDDIRTLSPERVKSEIGDIDLIMASPECTNHSVAKGAQSRDEASRMTAFEVIRFAKEFMPRWIVLENVVQMQSWAKHDKVLDALWKLGYFVRQVEINAQNCGVPQSRNRLFLLCSLSKEVNFQQPVIESYKTASLIVDKENVAYKASALRSDKRAKATLARADRAIAALGTDTPFLIVYYGSDGSGGWQSLNRPLRTITTIDRFAYVEPSRDGHIMRMLQPEELKLAMGFQREYIVDIPGITRRQKIQLLGNAVCPPVMEYIVRSLASS